MKPNSPFHWPVRIYWEDTDAGGVVYHARYLAFMERARSEWMRTMGYGQEAMRSGDGQVFVVRAMNLDFLKPAKLDDQLTVTVQVCECRRTSVRVEQQIRREDQLLLKAAVHLVAVGTRSFRPQAIEAALLAKLQQQRLISHPKNDLPL